MKKQPPFLSIFLCFTMPFLCFAAAPESLLSGMHGKWQVDDNKLPEPLFMTIDVETKTVTVSNSKHSKSDKFTVGFEEGTSIVLIARDHREAMYFEIKDGNTMLTRTDGNKASRTLKRVSGPPPATAPVRKMP